MFSATYVSAIWGQGGAGCLKEVATYTVTIIDRFHYTKSKSSSQSNHTLFGSALYVSSYFESQSYFECMQLCIIRKCFIRMRCTDHTQQYLTWTSHMLYLSATAVCSTHTGAVHTYVYASAYSNTWRLFDHTSELTSECTTTVSLTDTAMHVTDMNVRSSTYVRTIVLRRWALCPYRWTLTCTWQLRVLFFPSVPSRTLGWHSTLHEALAHYSRSSHWRESEWSGAPLYEAEKSKKTHVQ